MRDYVDYAYYVSLGLSLGLFFWDASVTHVSVLRYFFMYIRQFRGMPYEL